MPCDISGSDSEEVSADDGGQDSVVFNAAASEADGLLGGEQDISEPSESSEFSRISIFGFRLFGGGSSIDAAAAFLARSFANAALTLIQSSTYVQCTKFQSDLISNLLIKS